MFPHPRRNEEESIFYCNSAQFSNRDFKAGGETIAERLAELERRYPDFRFRVIEEQEGIREHIKILVTRNPATKFREKT